MKFHNYHGRPILVGFAILIFCGNVESEPSCDKLIGPINNCHCRYSDGGVPPTFRNIDFSPLGRNDGKPAFTYKIDPGDNHKYAYNPCHPFKDEFCTEDTAACRVSSNGQNPLPIGDPNVVAFEVIDSDIVLTYAEVGGRSLAVVNFVCNENALRAATYEPLGQQSGAFHFRIGTCLACLKDMPNCHSGDGGGSLTVGGIVCIIFTVLVVVYIIGGILFQKLGRGARGKELLPNYGFWSDFPMLIKDGFMFVIGPCRRAGGGSADYESIE